MRKSRNMLRLDVRITGLRNRYGFAQRHEFNREPASLGLFFSATLLRMNRVAIDQQNITELSVSHTIVVIIVPSLGGDARRVDLITNANNCPRYLAVNCYNTRTYECYVETRARRCTNSLDSKHRAIFTRGYSDVRALVPAYDYYSTQRSVRVTFHLFGIYIRG